MPTKTEAVVAATAPKHLENHLLTTEVVAPGILYEKRPAVTPDGKVAEGLFHARITLDNPGQFNAYTTDMLRGLILAMRAASAARDVVSVVVTASGDKAFCTGGNVKEYAEYYVSNPQEFRQYLRLFVDMVTSILTCDKPVICRVNGMRIGGGQEIGMACDFSIAQDMARFGQAGPKHGSSPVGGSSDFLPPMIGVEASMVSAVLCEPFSAHEAYYLGMLTDIVPALKVDGKFLANPLVWTDRMLDEYGRLVYGKSKSGAALAEGKALLAKGKMDLSLLDEKVDEVCAKLVMTFPDCVTKTLEELRKPKLDAWHRHKEGARTWMALNIMTEGHTGFRAFNEGTKDAGREADYVALRQALAKGTPWTKDLVDSLMPGVNSGKK
jgi:6-oxo-cyclohex-1-ene-carbonyl-CoA hydrolase